MGDIDTEQLPAIVLIVWILVREFLLHMRQKKEGKDPITKLFHHVAELKQVVVDVAEGNRELLRMHHDSDSKFSTVHLQTKLEACERHMTETLQRIERDLNRRAAER